MSLSCMWAPCMEVCGTINAFWEKASGRPILGITAKGAVTCAVCPESAWLVTFFIGNVSTGVVTWSALRCGASGESGKKVAAGPLSKTAAAAAVAKT